MNRTVKRVLIGIGGVIGLAVAGTVVKFYVLSPKSRPAPTMTAPTTPEAIEHGRYLANHVTGCIVCHTAAQTALPGEPPVEGKYGAGRDFGELPGSPIHLRAANITPDKAMGIGSSTDGEVARAVREGIGKDGHPLFPQMPYTVFREVLSDADVLDIIAYLRTLPASSNDPGRTTVAFPISMFIRTIPQPLGNPPPPAPAPSDKEARGQWLLKAALCAECHDSMNERMEKIPGKAFAGGTKFPLPGDKGFVIVPNITSDAATGIGSFSEDDLRRVFEDGKGKDGRSLYIMPWTSYKGMTKEDKEALFTALRKIPPVVNAVPRSEVKP